MRLNGKNIYLSFLKGDKGEKGDPGLDGSGANPNLIINGDFRVNQRGLTTYTGVGYGADLWNSENANGTIEILEKGVRFSASGGSAYLVNRIEDSNLLENKQCTLTIYLLDGTKYSATQILGTEGKSYCWINLKDNNNTIIGDCRVWYYIGTKTYGVTITMLDGNSVEVEKVKLEYGSIATPYTPRPYAEELSMCQRYYLPTKLAMYVGRTGFSDETTCYIFIPTPTTMRPYKTVVLSSITIYCNGQTKTPSEYVIDSVSANGVSVTCTIESGFGVRQPVMASVGSGTYIDARIQ